MKPLVTGSAIFTDEKDKAEILNEIEQDLEIFKPVLDDKTAYRIDWKIVYGRLFGK